jgi:hypothetical protein
LKAFTVCNPESVFMSFYLFHFLSQLFVHHLQCFSLTLCLLQSGFRLLRGISEFLLSFGESKFGLASFALSRQLFFSQYLCPLLKWLFNVSLNCLWIELDESEEKGQATCHQFNDQNREKFFLLSLVSQFDDADKGKAGHNYGKNECTHYSVGDDQLNNFSMNCSVLLASARYVEIVVIVPVARVWNYYSEQLSPKGQSAIQTCSASSFSMWKCCFGQIWAVALRLGEVLTLETRRCCFCTDLTPS